MDDRLRRLTEQVVAWRDVVTGLANVSEVTEHMIGLHQGMLLDLVGGALKDGCGHIDVLRTTRDLAQVIVVVAERDDLPLSHEMDALLREYQLHDVGVTRAIPLSHSRPLARFPKEPPVVHTVFVDEAGTASFAEESQPVLCLTGVLVEDRRIEEFDLASAVLLDRLGLPPEAEVHAQEVLSGASPFCGLTVENREAMLFSFMELGLKHCVGVHYMAMLKPLVKGQYRADMARRGLDAYTSNVLYFNASLHAAAFGRIGLAKYRYLFDRTDRYGRDIKKILTSLQRSDNQKLRLTQLHDEPRAVDSRAHRFVQLADVMGYYLCRHRQFEVRTFTPRESLRKHETKYLRAYELIQPKVMSFVKDHLYMLTDWASLNTWQMPSSRKDAPHTRVASAPKAPRNSPCPCGSGSKYKKCCGR